MNLKAARRRRVLLGYAAALVAAMSYGTGAIVAKKAVTDVASPMTTTAFSLMFGTLVMLVVLPRMSYRDMTGAPRRSYVYIALAGISGVWGVGFFHLALIDAPVALVTTVSSSYPLMAIAMVHFFMQRLERVTLRTLLGSVLVVVGIGLVSVGQAV